MGDIEKLAEQTESKVIPADATSIEDLENLVEKAMNDLGSKLDFVLHSIGMSVNVRKGKEYTDLNHDWMTKGWDVSAVSFHKLMQTLFKLDAMNEWGSIVALTYIASQRTFPNYNDMADNKAYLESIARSFGYYFGKEKKVRVNTISQSPTLTTAGKGVKGLDDFLNYAELTSPLGNASAEECADYTISLFSDYTRKVTLQNLYNDGGFSNVGVAIRMGDIEKLAEQTESKVIPADATSIEDLENLVEKAMNDLGSKLDFVLHSIGMSVNVRKGKEYTDLNHDWMTKGWDVSAVSFHKLMQTLFKLDAMNEWGSIVALTYIASQRTFPNYNDMADNKAYLESIARSFGYYFGKEKKVRVNTISQSPTLTTAGKGVKGLDDFLNYAELTSPLGNASAEECADYTISLFSDYTRKVTLQNLYNDGGFSNVGVSQEIIDKLKNK